MNEKTHALPEMLKQQEARYADDPVMRQSIERMVGCLTNVEGRPYSLRNVLVLAGQAEARQMSITQLAGFKTWPKHGRAVRKGETGLRVFAPHSWRRDGE